MQLVPGDKLIAVLQQARQHPELGLAQPADHAPAHDHRVVGRQPDANGLALAARIKGESYHVYCLMGDGETHEGQVWEAARSAVQQRLGNLTAIIDRNRLKAMDRSYQADDLAALPDKWQAFGWRVVQVDGHDMSALVHALDWARTQSRGPALIIAETIKGKGVSFMEDQPAYHNAALTATQFEAALQELDRALAGLEDQA